MHHQAIIEINSVPTTIETWGRWIEEKPTKETSKDIVLCIPGNPGVTNYYRKFLTELHNQLKCPVWIIGHAGHQKIKSNIQVPALDENKHLYDVQAQIDNKIEFFHKYIPEDARIHLIGHSVGAYICLHLLKRPEIYSKVQKSYLLFPTLENIEVTPNGQFLMNIIKYIVWLTLFFSLVFSYLPEFIQNFGLYVYCKITQSRKFVIPATKELIYPDVLDKVFYMAFDEMKLVRDIDPDLINSSKSKLKLYYGANDNWAPADYCKKLQREYPDLDAEICTRNFDHAFVLRTSEDVGKMVAEWIKPALMTK